MTKARGDQLWLLFTTLVDDVLNPLCLLWLALFMSLGYLLSLLAPVNIDAWVALLWLSLLAPLAALTLRARARWEARLRRAPPFSARALLPALPTVFLLPASIALLSLPSLMAISHVNVNFVYVTQLTLRSAPPESIFVPGYPPNHYWLFHAFIAALVQATGLDVYSIANLVAAVFIFSSLYWLGRSLIALELAAARTLKLGILLLFVYGALNLTGILSVFSRELAGADIIHPGLTLLDGADRRLSSIYSKVFHPSGMTPAVTAFTATLFVCASSLQGAISLRGLALVSASGIVTLGAMPVITPFLVIPLVGALVVTKLWEGIGRPPRRQGMLALACRFVAGISPRALLLWFGLSALLALPLLVYTQELTYSSRGAMSVAPMSEVNMGLTLAAQLLLLPMFCLHAIHALRRRSSSDRFLFVAGFCGLAIALSLLLPDQNQYKFHYLLSMLLALSTLRLLAEWRRGDRQIVRRAGQALMFAFLALALGNAVYGNLALIDRAQREYGSAAYSGHRIELTDPDAMGGRLAALYWIRDHAPLDAIALVPHAYTEDAHLYHERLSFVTMNRWSYFAEGIPAYDRRVVELHRFYDRTSSPEAYAALLESLESQLPSRPLYAVAHEPELSPALMDERGATRVFSNPAAGAHVYLLNPGSAAQDAS